MDVTHVGDDLYDLAVFKFVLFGRYLGVICTYSCLFRADVELEMLRVSIAYEFIS